MIGGQDGCAFNERPHKSSSDSVAAKPMENILRGKSSEGNHHKHVRRRRTHTSHWYFYVFLSVFRPFPTCTEKKRHLPHKLFDGGGANSGRGTARIGQTLESGTFINKYKRTTESRKKKKAERPTSCECKSANFILATLKYIFSQAVLCHPQPPTVACN